VKSSWLDFEWEFWVLVNSGDVPVNLEGLKSFSDGIFGGVP
jgi:hypothetical protein